MDATLVESDNSAPQSTLAHVILHVFDTIHTLFNSFGIACDYHHRPSHDPDLFVSIDQLLKSHDEEAPVPIPSAPHILPLPPWPWKNMSIWRIMTWMMTGTKQKSEAEVTWLANMLQSDNFDPHDLQGFNAHTKMKHFDRSESVLDESNPLWQDGWRESLVDILVPTQEHNLDGNGWWFTIGGLFHWPLTTVFHSVFADADAKWFHLTPFKQIWCSPVTGHEQHLYDELYTLDVWNEAHDTLQKQKHDDGCKLERVITGLMFWFDATHLAQFGSASTWPVYLFCGNQSKYLCACPTSGACHPVAFIPTVSLEAYLMTVSKHGNLIIHSPSIASAHYHWFHLQIFKEEELQRHPDSLQTRAYSWSLDDFTRCRISWRVLQWHRDQMFWWKVAQIVSTYFHILHGLSRKVGLGLDIASDSKAHYFQSTSAQFKIRVTAHVPDVWFPRQSFTTLAFSQMLYDAYQRFAATFKTML